MKVDQWIHGLFRDRGFTITDRDHFCYAFVKRLQCGKWLYVGKHLEEGGSDLPIMLGEPVYEELESNTGEHLTCNTWSTLSDYLREVGI